MRSIKIVLLAGLCMSAFTLTSCEKEDILPAPATQGPGKPTNPTNPTTPTSPVTSTSLVKQFGLQTYRYDAQKRLVEVVFMDVTPHAGYTISYEGDKPVRLDFKHGHYLLYTYSGDKVVRARQYDAAHVLQFDHAFEYSGNLLTKKTTITYSGIPTGHLSIIDYKYDANGNLTEQVITWSPSNSPDDMRGPRSVYFGNYDTKINPLPFAENFIYLPGIKYSTNNPGFRDPGTNRQFFIYTYHESGMPKTRTFTIEGEPDFQPYTDMFSY